MGTDYYKLLGISKTATDDEIKKAYKKMVSSLIICSRTSSLTLFQALKWHPDRNKGSEEANQKFKEVCLHPFVDANYHNVRVFKSDIRSLRGSERRQQARCL
jgi:hypothetical protein